VSARAQGFVLEPGSGSLRTLLVDTWDSRRLLLTLARKDFFVRYRRASLGILWAVGLPLLQAVVLTIVFSRVGRINAGTTFAVFVFAGMAPWSFFTTTFGTGSTAIVDNAVMASRVYFPRMILPLVTVVANVYSFAVSIVILVLLSLGLRVHLGASILLLIPGVALVVLLAAAFSLVASALHVYFRDVRFLVQASLIAWFWLTPIFYPLSLVEGALKKFILVNPMTGVVEVFRAATVGADADAGIAVGFTLLWSAVLLISALLLHRRHDRLFTDLL
jgi:lipopolysaccharide transport system permease protein